MIARQLMGVMFGLAALASAPSFGATYTFAGHPYQSANGSYTTAMSVSGNFMTASPLQPNLPFQDVQALVTSWSFSDGVNAYTSLNSVPNGDIQVQTDAGGNIIAWSLSFVTPKPPWVANVTPVNSVSFYTGTSTSTQQATTGGICQNTTGLCSPLAFNVNNQASYLGAFDSWVTTAGPIAAPMPVPTLSGLGLLVIAILMAVGASGALRLNQAHAG